MTDREDPGQEAIKTAREKFAKQGDIPSGIASGGTSKTIKSALDKTDGQRESQVLKKMYDQYGNMQGVLNMSESGQKGGSDPNDQGVVEEPPSPKELSSGTKDLLTRALTGTLCNFSNLIGYEKVVISFQSCLSAMMGEEGSKINGYEYLTKDYQEVVSTSLINLAVAFKDSKGKLLTTDVITIPDTPVIPEGSDPPPNIVDNPPLYAIQHFYTADEDPYPGYIEWETMDGKLVYTLRGLSPAFESSDDAICFNVQVNLIAKLTVPVATNTLKAEDLYKILDDAANDIESNSSEVTLGNTGGSPMGNSGNSGGNSKNNMLQQLLPQLKQLTQKAKTDHLPKSVLQQGKMNKLLENLEKKKTENKRMAGFADQAVAGEGSPLGSIFGGDTGQMFSVIGNVQSLVKVGGKTKGIGGLTSVVSSLGGGIG